MKELTTLEKVNSIASGINVFCTFLLVIVGFFGVWIYRGQLETMNGQLEVMKEGNRAALASAYTSCVAAQISRSSLIELQRGEGNSDASAQAARRQALISVRSQAAYINPDFRGPIVMHMGLKVGLPFKFRNTGATSARNIVVKTRIELLHVDEEPDFSTNVENVGSIITPELTAGEEPSSLTALQGASMFELDEKRRPVLYTVQDINDLTSGRSRLYFIGRISFLDIFGVHHWRTFCRSTSMVTVDGLNEEGSHSCARFNREDTNTGVPEIASPKVMSPVVPDIDCEVLRPAKK